MNRVSMFLVTAQRKDWKIVKFETKWRCSWLALKLIQITNPFFVPLYYYHKNYSSQQKSNEPFITDNNKKIQLSHGSEAKTFHI